MASSIKNHRLLWHEWLCHSNFSFLIGASHPHEYVLRASELGYAGLGIADYDGVYGIVRAFRAQRSLVHPLRLFYGAEIHLKRDHQLPLVFQDTVVLYARTLRGYGYLCEILSYARREGKQEAQVPLEQLLTFAHDDIICIQPMRGIMRSRASAETKYRCALLKEHFGRDFYLTISRHRHPAEDCWITRVQRLGRELNCSILMSQDVYFHDAAAKRLNDLLHAIRHNSEITAITEQLFANDQRHLHALAEISALYSGLEGFNRSLRLSQELAESFAFDLTQLRYHYPQEMIPAGSDSLSYLTKLVWQGAHAFYGDQLPTKVEQLLVKELALIEHLEFADYFLTVWDIVHWARKQKILCQGRGSAANSAICFVLGITAVDPMRFDLLFERFLSLERGDPPDIDVDFEHERREEVIQYIYRRYGRDRTAMVANVITYRSRSAIRATGKALGIPVHLLDKAADQKSTRQPPTVKVSDVDRTPADDKYRELSWQLWSELSERLKGFPRHMGIHVGGFVITDKPINSLVPQEPATMPGRSVIQWSKDDIEALAFFKIDILALGILSAIRKTFQLVARHYHQNITLATLPQEDQATYTMVQRADTVGTFQIESRAQMSMLPRLRPRTFYDLVVQVGIIRPGPIQGGLIHPYLRRRCGEEKVVFAHPSLEPILQRTLGVPIFQEQVMRVAMAVGGFSPGEADDLRKHIGSFALKKNLAPMIEKLKVGMAAHGIKQEFIDQTIGHLRGFADYGFPESHAVSFALLAYASAYLKCHYPAAFCVALLNSQPMGFYSPHTLIHDAKRAGIMILPICVQHSAWDATLERSQDASAPQGTVYAIRLGLAMVRGLTSTVGQQLVAQREALGGWSSLELFLQDSRIYRGDLTALAAAGALSVWGIERRQAIWLAAAAPFAPLLEKVVELADAPFGKEDAMTEAQRDFAATQTTLGRHPAEILKQEFWHYRCPVDRITPAARVLTAARNTAITVFGMVLVRQAPPTAKGMVFMTLEDESGFVNLVFTPDKYQKLQKIVDHQGFLCAWGKLQLWNESHSIMVCDVYPYQMQPAEVIPMKSPAVSSVTDAVCHTSLQLVRQYM